MTFEEQLPSQGEENSWLTAFIRKACSGVEDLTELDRKAGDGDFGANIDVALGDIELPVRGPDAEVLVGIAHRFFVRAGKKHQVQCSVPFLVN